MQASELPEVIVFLEPGSDATDYARTHGLTLKRALKSDPNAYIFATGTPQRARLARQGNPAADRRVRKFYQNHRARRVRYGFTANDQYFSQQWNLINNLGTGIDVRVKIPWAADKTGAGVIMALVDDGLQHNHPDLSPNYSAANSWDFGQHDADPSPVYTTGNTSLDDNHGTVVGGIMAARGGNTIGISGVAPLAKLACMRLDFSETSSSSEADSADAILYRSSGLNTSVKIKNHSYGYNQPWQEFTLERDALKTSAAAGTIHAFAAGNERRDSGYTRDANKNVYQNSPDVITMAAVGANGLFESYSSFGACVFATAPAKIISTDRTGADGYNSTGQAGAFPDTNYSNGNIGTSFSSPMGAGVFALVKQAQPKLNTRFLKHLLARYSDIVDAGDTTEESDGGWKGNRAGFKFNQNYGFGLVNAYRLVQGATKYSGVTPLQTYSTGLIRANAAIPDNNPTGLSRSFYIYGNQPMEELQVTLTLRHSWIGDVEIYVTSPGGTTSRLVMADGGDDNDTSNSPLTWTFLTNAFWQEVANGRWTLTVKDTISDWGGTLESFSATARMGKLQPPNSARMINYE